MVEVSAAKRNITPPFPMYMRGYAMRTGKSIGVLDELYCRTLVLRIDGEIFIWSTLDLCRLEEPISDYARTVLAGKYSVPKENIIIGTIHTHSGPDISFEDEGEDRNHRKAVYRELVMKMVLYFSSRAFPTFPKRSELIFMLWMPRTVGWQVNWNIPATTWFSLRNRIMLISLSLGLSI